MRSSVTITTVAPPSVIQTITAPAGQATFTIATSPGHTYRVQYRDELSSPAPWTQLDRDFVAAGPYCSISDFCRSGRHALHSRHAGDAGLTPGPAPGQETCFGPPRS